MSPFFSRHPRGELSPYVDGQLSPARRDAVEAHLASCDACTTEVAELRSLRSALGALPEAAPPRSFALTAAQVSAPEPVGPDRGYAGMPLAQGLRLAAAGLGVALIAVVLIDTGGLGNDDPSPSTEMALQARSGDDSGDDDDGFTESAAVPESGDDAAADAGGDSLAAESPAPPEDGESGGASGGTGGAFMVPGSTPDSTSGGEPAATAALGPAPVPPSPTPADIADIDRSGDDTRAPAHEGDEDSTIRAYGGVEETSDAVNADAEAVASADSDDGPSTLRIIQVALAVGLVAAVAGSFVLPRLRYRP